MEGQIRLGTTGVVTTDADKVEARGNAVKNTKTLSMDYRAAHILTKANPKIGGRGSHIAGGQRMVLPRGASSETGRHLEVMRRSQQAE